MFGLGGNECLGFFHLGAGGVHQAGSPGRYGLTYGIGNAVGPDDHRGAGRNVRRILHRAHAFGRVFGQDLGIVDDGAEGQDRIFLADQAGQFFEGQVHPHAEAGRAGAYEFHAESPAARRSASSIMASKSFQDIQWQSRSRKARQPGSSRR